MKPENKGKSVLLEDGKIMKCPNFVQNGNCDGRSQGDIAECWRVGYDGYRGDSMQDTKKSLQEFEKWIHADPDRETMREIRDRREIKRIIERELVKENRYEIIKGEMCFKTSTNGYIRLDTIGGDYNCIVIEFAENKKEAMNNRFEDGDLLYIADLGIKEMTDIVAKQIKED